MNQKLDEVSDPSDFLTTTQPQLADLDKLLRCEICKDYFQDPMITSCSHTFCSLCIRTVLANDGKCPTCRQGDQAVRLRKNWVIREVVANWATARRGVLDAVWKRKEEEEKDDDGRVASRSSSPGRKRSVAEVDEPIESPRYRTRRRQKAQPLADAEKIDVELLADREPGHTSEQLSEDEAGRIVGCPVCGTDMRNDQVYNHLNTCDGTKRPSPAAPAQNSLSRANTKSGQRHSNPTVSTSRPPSRTTTTNTKPPQPTPDHLAFLNYNLLKETALRKKLQDLGIPATGSKQQMEKRHKHWVNVYNANCDSERPRSKRELLRELDVWESTIGSRAMTVGPLANGIMKKEFDRERYSTSHSHQYNDLIAKARESAKANKTGAKEAPLTDHMDIDKPAQPVEEAPDPAKAVFLNGC